MSKYSLKRFSLIHSALATPPPIVASLQTDGSFRYKDCLSRTACILKDEGEVYQSVKTYFNHINSYESEWCSVLDGIKLTQSHQIGELQLENDNLSVIHCLVNQRIPKHPYAANYYKEVLMAARYMDWVEIRWIPRKLNKADGLFRLS